MINSENRKWTNIGGNWEEVVGRVVKQSKVEDLTRRFIKTSWKEFSIQTTFKVEKHKQRSGEVKILFSNADKGENYRVDLMLEPNVCRVTWAQHYQIAQPYEFVENREYRVEIRVIRNLLYVKIDDVELFSGFKFGKESDGRIGIGTFDAAVTFSWPVINQLKHMKCFVAMCFDGKRDIVYTQAVEPSLKEHPTALIKCTRADQIRKAGRIVDDIFAAIQESNFLIVDLSEDNLNVYYELGFSHGNNIKKPTFLIIEEDKETPLSERVPFDIKHLRVIEYEFSTKGLDELRKELRSMLMTHFP